MKNEKEIALDIPPDLYKIEEKLLILIYEVEKLIAKKLSIKEEEIKDIKFY